MNKVAKIGFWGYPDPDTIKKVKSDYPNAEWIDLDIDFYYPKTNILPESYCKIIRNIIDNTIYLFQEKEDILDDELKTACKKLSLMIDDYDIYYINISAKKIEDRKEFYQKLGFTLSYYDVNKLNKLYAGNKNKSLYLNIS